MEGRGGGGMVGGGGGPLNAPNLANNRFVFWEARLPDRPDILVYLPVMLAEWPVAALEWPVAALEWPVAALERPVAALEWPLTALEWPVAPLEWPLTALEWLVTALLAISVERPMASPSEQTVVLVFPELPAAVKSWPLKVVEHSVMVSEKLLFWTAASELDTSRSARSVMRISESTSVVLLDG
jgi:hypothetical protein